MINKDKMGLKSHLGVVKVSVLIVLRNGHGGLTDSKSLKIIFSFDFCRNSGTTTVWRSEISEFLEEFESLRNNCDFRISDVTLSL